MPSERQVRVHYEVMDQMRQREEERARQAQAQQAQQGYASQSALMNQQAALQAQHSQMQFGQQQALSQQGYQQQGGLAAQHVDLQARLQQVTLNQAEEQRLNRLHQARAAVEDNAELAPHERAMLLTQLESGLNPLENRQRESSMLFSHLQSQGLAQQNEQQATLFNQRQERLAQGAQGRLQVLQDPLTGRSQLHQMNLDGEWHPVDFGLAGEHNERENARAEMGLAEGAQGLQQRSQLFPGQVQAQQLANQRTQQALTFAAQLQPANVRHGELVNRHIVEQMRLGANAEQLAQTTGYAHLADLAQRMNHAAAAEPNNLNLQAANVQLARQRLVHLQESHADATEQHQAQLELSEATRRHTQATTRATEQATTTRGDSGAPYLMNLPDGTSVPVYRGPTGEVHQIPDTARVAPAQIAGVQNHVHTEMNDELRDVPVGQPRPAWAATPQSRRDEFEDRVNHRLDIMETELRRQHGLPPHPTPRRRTTAGGGAGRADVDRLAGQALNPPAAPAAASPAHRQPGLDGR